MSSMFLTRIKISTAFHKWSRKMCQKNFIATLSPEITTKMDIHSSEKEQ